MKFLNFVSGFAGLATTYLAGKDAKEARADRKADRAARSKAASSVIQPPPGLDGKPAATH